VPQTKVNLQSLLPGHRAARGQVLTTAYTQELLGPRTFGRVLNVGAGIQSHNYQFHLRLNNDEYHTLEISGDQHTTYVGSVTNMPDVPTASYDWVLANAVLEHVDDIHAAAREIARVTKPGGRIYLQTPFHNEIHFVPNVFADFWRLTPFGYIELLKNDFVIEEFEFWGNSVIDPVGIGVFARRLPVTTAPAITSRLILIDGGLEEIEEPVDGATPFLWSYPVYVLRIDWMEYLAKVMDARERFFVANAAPLGIVEADRAIRARAAVVEGYLIIHNNGAEFKRVTHIQVNAGAGQG
jgi:SAM-dependent methyltransferase